jgi:hypothetical protein
MNLIAKLLPASNILLDTDLTSKKRVFEQAGLLFENNQQVARNVVFDGRTRGRTPITLVGVKDSIIVLTDDATLVATKAESQKIKDLVRKLAADPRWAELV